eukprot:21029_3
MNPDYLKHSFSLSISGGEFFSAIGGRRRSISEDVTTQTDDSAIAPPATIGGSVIPVNGRTPAAMGMPMTLMRAQPK